MRELIVLHSKIKLHFLDEYESRIMFIYKPKGFDNFLYLAKGIDDTF